MLESSIVHFSHKDMKSTINLVLSFTTHCFIFREIKAPYMARAEHTAISFSHSRGDCTEAAAMTAHPCHRPVLIHFIKNPPACANSCLSSLPDVLSCTPSAFGGDSSHSGRSVLYQNPQGSGCSRCLSPCGDRPSPKGAYGFSAHACKLSSRISAPDGTRMG